MRHRACLLLHIRAHEPAPCDQSRLLGSIFSHVVRMRTRAGIGTLDTVDAAQAATMEPARAVERLAPSEAIANASNDYPHVAHRDKADKAASRPRFETLPTSTEEVIALKHAILCVVGRVLTISGAALFTPDPAEAVNRARGLFWPGNPAYQRSSSRGSEWTLLPQPCTGIPP